MNYKTSLPRAVFAIIAVAMTAMTVALTVVAPAKVDANNPDARILAVPATATRTIAAVIVTSPHVEVATHPKSLTEGEVVVTASRLPILGVTSPNAAN